MSLLQYLPESYQNSPETIDLLTVMDNQTDRLYNRYLDFLDQLQVCTASWGLSFWEQIYAVPVDISKPEQERREILYSKMRAIGSVTPEMIRSLAAAFSEGEPIVTEFPSEYRFTVSIGQSLDRTTYVRGMYAAIEEMKPAHLQAGYEVKYQPVNLAEKEDVFFRHFRIKSSFWNGFGSDSILLNGSHRLDGTWLLDQSVQGIRFHEFGVKTAQKNQNNLSASLQKHDLFYLDGTFLLDGSRTLSGGITEEEI
ncbi:MAG: DUF2313 domain-containing protein [Clostridiales bacterium]|jgi:hypothetical protein|nr:DUF2313 domain-containing protein [Clostridiales bacterium]